MNHEYRESPYSPGVCAGCGLSFSLCAGMKAKGLPSFLSSIDAAMEGPWYPQTRPSFPKAPVQSEWDAWCARFGIDPNTPDETVLDDYLHGRTPGARIADLPRSLWLTPAARAEVHELERWFRL